ncbi:60S ribosomal protein L18a-like isoform X1 [Mus caroli]|uniref:Large ribosomal subunit protein eL20 n=1 Tax=Mus caroli TaxID=10089 RepID=A0A6P5PUG9_MUSCR|nr:60S ribosomal protein L18a-like isoform X1 [Mus caroli]XP_021022317.1 60S ribosomal protein L18a-like isoform X1 [Mus caroli]XP_021022318.1 60S ribosomal protein L18a-like isoform X1 [Mus caroli]
MAAGTKIKNLEAQIASGQPAYQRLPRSETVMLIALPAPAKDYLCLSITAFCFCIVLAIPALLFSLKLKKMKKSFGETVYCGKVFEKSPVHVKNFGIWLCYDSCSGTHNMYREYQNLTTAGAVTQCYLDMGARHHAHAHSIQFMKVEEIAIGKCHQPAVKQFHSKIKFPLSHHVLQRQHKPRFTTKSPNTFF